MSIDILFSDVNRISCAQKKPLGCGVWSNIFVLSFPPLHSTSLVSPFPPLSPLQTCPFLEKKKRRHETVPNFTSEVDVGFPVKVQSSPSKYFWEEVPPLGEVLTPYGYGHSGVVGPDGHVYVFISSSFSISPLSSDF